MRISLKQCFPNSFKPLLWSITLKSAGGGGLCSGQHGPGKGVATALTAMLKTHCTKIWEAATEDLASVRLSQGQVLLSVLCNQALFSWDREMFYTNTGALLILLLFVAPKIVCVGGKPQCRLTRVF